MNQPHPYDALQSCDLDVSSPLPAELPIGFEDVLRRLAPRARALDVVAPAQRGHPPTRVLFVPGEDDSGRHDACLVDQATYERGAPICAHVDGCIYEFHLRRVRARGRGWVLAGFEMAAALAHAGIASTHDPRVTACAARR